MFAKMSSAFYAVIILVLHLRRSASVDVGDERLFFQHSPTAGGRTVVVEEGQDVVLDCEAGGRPSPTIHWLRDGVRIHQGAETTAGSGDESSVGRRPFGEKATRLEMSLTKARLFIDCARQSDAGVYTCVAETPSKRVASSTVLFLESNGLPQTGRRCVTKRPIAALSQSSTPARLYMWTATKLELEGTDTRLFCRAEGKPTPKITWYDSDNHLIQPTDHQYRVLDNGDLLIRNVDWTKHGGLYRCVAKNSGGNDEVDTFLYPTKP